MMVSARTPNDPAPESRPEGRIKPRDLEIEAAFDALVAGDVDRAADHLTFVEVHFGLDGAWRLFLAGGIAEQRRHFPEAINNYNLAFTRAFVAATGCDGTFDARCLRLGALALAHAGRLYRRQERAEDAERTHLAGYHLAVLHGSYEELWELRVELGLDAALLGKFEEAVLRFEGALKVASSCVEDRHLKLAVARSRLADVLAESGRWGDAIEAARAARDHWRDHDITHPAAVRADVTLGSMLLRYGQSQMAAGESAVAVESLTEAVRLLADAREALLAFGGSVREEAASCGEQLDFAERLRASVES